MVQTREGGGGWAYRCQQKLNIESVSLASTQSLGTRAQPYGTVSVPMKWYGMVLFEMMPVPVPYLIMVFNPRYIVMFENKKSLLTYLMLLQEYIFALGENFTKDTGGLSSSETIER